MIGKCFVRGNNLEYNKTDSQWQSYDEVCDPRDDQSTEGMCLAGMSAAVTQMNIFLGAPGCFNWQGEGNLFPVNNIFLSKCKMPFLNSLLMIFYHSQEIHIHSGITRMTSLIK